MSPRAKSRGCFNNASTLGLDSARPDNFIGMFYQIKSYLQFLTRSSNQHGVHSPFVYDLIINCFYDKKKYPAYNTLKQHRQLLLADSSTIAITDFGQGSRVFKSNTRKVADIAKNAGIPAKRQRLLYRLVRYLQPESALELGTSLGLATTAMALGNPDAAVDTVEGCPETAQKASEVFQKLQIKNIELHTTPFEAFFTSEFITPQYEMVYVDGNHNKEKTLEYFQLLLKHATNETVFIFDDIYWSSEMQEAWEEIKGHPQVSVSIDTFYWGLVFFRSEQQKQHFSIRL